MATNIIDHALRVLRSAGFHIENFDHSDLSVDADQFTFCLDSEGRVQIWRWTGSYPWAVDREMGELASIEEAASYINWWLKADDDRYMRQVLPLLEPDPWGQNGAQL